MKEERNRVYIRSCKMVLWPIRVRLLFELFYKMLYYGSFVSVGVLKARNLFGKFSKFE